mmetsp:Transcript_8563/g.14786  ORF Transcript_8563/g.14786 Transcript_8563/m.14786 type:complete len:170 (+) Transcript_8563:335-844(+)
MVPTMQPHRLIEFAKRHDKQDAVVEEIFHQFFEKAAVINRKSVLVQIAKKTGLDEEEVSHYLDSDQDKEEITNEYREVTRMGVHGVPFFSIWKEDDNSHKKINISGGQPTEVFEKIFLKLGAIPTNDIDNNNNNNNDDENSEPNTSNNEEKTTTSNESDKNNEKPSAQL